MFNRPFYLGFGLGGVASVALMVGLAYLALNQPSDSWSSFAALLVLGAPGKILPFVFFWGALFGGCAGWLIGKLSTTMQRRHQTRTMQVAGIESMMRARGFVVAAILSMAAVPAVADDIVGRVRVIDGDTIEINGTRIQLWGIDAPEIDQLCRGENSQLYECGEKSATALAGILHAIGRPAICTPKGEDQHHHILAVCKIGDPGPDIAHWMVANGHALDWPKHSGGYYAGAQQKAQAAGRGFWAGSFVAPWIFRDCIRDETPSYCSDEAK